MRHKNDFFSIFDSSFPLENQMSFPLTEFLILIKRQQQQQQRQHQPDYGNNISMIIFPRVLMFLPTQVMVMNMNNNNVGRIFKDDDIDDIVNTFREDQTSGNVFV